MEHLLDLREEAQDTAAHIQDLTHIQGHIVEVDDREVAVSPLLAGEDNS